MAGKIRKFGGKLFVLVAGLSLLTVFACARREVSEQQAVAPEESSVESVQVDVVVNSRIGEVHFYNPRGEEERIEVGDRITEGYKVITGPTGRVDLEVPGYGVMRVARSSEFRVSRLGRDSAYFFIKKGTVVNALKKLGKRSYQIASPTAVVGVRGTAFAVVASEKVTRVAVLKGEVEVKRGSRKVKVKQLQEANVGTDRVVRRKVSASTAKILKEAVAIKNVGRYEDVEYLNEMIRKMELVLKTSSSGSESESFEFEKNVYEGGSVKSRGSVEEHRSNQTFKERDYLEED